MVCENGGCPNAARVTLYKGEKKVDVCSAHQFIFKQLNYHEQVLDDWKADYEKLPTENIFRNLVRKLKK